jgi:hypothetical protein
VEKRKARFELLAGIGQERRLIPQERALSEISPMSAPCLALPFHPPVIKLPGTSPDGAENGLPAGLDQGHVGVGEAEMVTDLVD